MFRLTVQDVFFIKGRGLVATGRVELGAIRVGDEVRINGARAVAVEAVEQFRKKVDEQGAFATYMDSATLAKFVDQELATWSKVIKSADIKPD